MSEEKILEAIDALEAPHDLVQLMRVLVTGVDITNHPNAEGDLNRRRAFTHLREDELFRNGKRTRGGAAAAPILLAVTRLGGHPAKAYARMLLVDLLASDHIPYLTTGVDVSDRKTKRRYTRGQGRVILGELAPWARGLKAAGLPPRDNLRRST